MIVLIMTYHQYNHAIHPLALPMQNPNSRHRNTPMKMLKAEKQPSSGRGRLIERLICPCTMRERSDYICSFFSRSF